MTRRIGGGKQGATHCSLMDFFIHFIIECRGSSLGGLESEAPRGFATDLAGGVYRLCWCGGAAGPCDVPGDFRVDAGGLTILGPATRAQHRTCVSGRPCAFDSLALQPALVADRVVALATCGAAPRPEQELLWVLTSGSRSQLAPAQSAARGGVYRLCWCGAGGACSSPEQFRVDIGSLTTIGISPFAQHRTCISGRPAPHVASVCCSCT